MLYAVTGIVLARALSPEGLPDDGPHSGACERQGYAGNASGNQRQRVCQRYAADIHRLGEAVGLHYGGGIGYERKKWPALKSYFPLGWKMMLTSFMNIVYVNIYSLLIGNRIGLVSLGYYTQADKWSKMGVSSLTHCGAVAEYLHVHDVASAAFRQQEIRGHGGEHHGYSSQEKQLEEYYGGVPFVAEQRVPRRLRSGCPGHNVPCHGHRQSRQSRART